MAALDGDWRLVMETPMGTREPKVTFRTDGKAVSGTWAGQMGSTDFSGGTLDGDALSVAITLEAMGQSIELKLSATIDGDKLTGQIESPRGTMTVSGTRA